MRFIRLTISSVVFLGSIGACGGSSTSSAPQVDTGLPPSEPMSQLSDQQAQQACQALADAINASFGGAQGTAFGCTLLAVASTPTPTTCQSQVKDCEANPPSGLPTTNFAPDCSQASASGLTNCTATVGDFERCADDALSTLRAYEAQFTCSIAGNLQKLEQIMTSQPTQPDSCVKLNSECPGGLFGTGSGGRTIPGIGSACTDNSDCATYGLVCDPQLGCVECLTDSDCMRGMACAMGVCRMLQSNTGGTGATGDAGLGGMTAGGVSGTTGGAGGTTMGGLGGAP